MMLLVSFLATEKITNGIAGFNRNNNISSKSPVLALNALAGIVIDSRVDRKSVV